MQGFGRDPCVGLLCCGHSFFSKIVFLIVFPKWALLFLPSAYTYLYVSALSILNKTAKLSVLCPWHNACLLIEKNISKHHE